MENVEQGTITAVVLYPDGAGRNRIMAVLRRIRDKLCPDIEVSVEWASFTYLESPKVRLFLTPILQQTDLLCIVAQGSTDLPLVVKSWLMSTPFSRRPLVALLEMDGGTTSGDASPVDTFLYRLAQVHHVDYLPYQASSLARKPGEVYEIPVIMGPSCE